MKYAALKALSLIVAGIFIGYKIPETFPFWILFIPIFFALVSFKITRGYSLYFGLFLIAVRVWENEGGVK